LLVEMLATRGTTKARLARSSLLVLSTLASTANEVVQLNDSGGRQRVDIELDLLVLKRLVNGSQSFRLYSRQRSGSLTG
jgi:hypothetical protein